MVGDTIRRRTALFSVVLSLLLTVQAFASDPYNAYRWKPTTRGAWYEWWYYKVVVPESKESFYFVYGVVNPWDFDQTNKASRAWTSFGSFTEKKILEDIRSPRDFFASYNEPFVQVGTNIATDRHLAGAITEKNGEKASWDIDIIKDWGFNAMGWAMFVGKLLNIYWYPAQASAQMNGWIEFNGKRHLLNQAPAYQDRNWGQSFPDWWAWLVANRFKNSPGTVLAAGGGRPRVFDRFEIMEGMAIGLRHNGVEYSFRPNDRDKVKTNISYGRWDVDAENRRGQRIIISAYAPREQFMRLPFMTPQGVEFSDYETLTGNIKVRLYDRRKLVADLETDEGGIEFGSPQRYDDGLKALFGRSFELE